MADATPEAVAFDGERTMKGGDSLTRPTLHAIASDLANEQGLSVRDLRGRTSTKEAAEAGMLLAEAAVGRYLYSVGEVAKFLGKHPGSVSRYLNTGERCHRELDANSI